ncbi:prosaposin [Puntigrus tetrazona]|uniref:prosaposin n=1 Tax=Puntigrus tetrazona TaxID=1606681 RepID=UPI001C89AFA3|nr:prosaposin [Puntigrus tetrazona]
MTAFRLEFFFFTALLGSVNTRSVDTTGVMNVLMGVDVTATGDMCQDCSKIFELLKDLLSNEDFQTKLTAALDQMCDKLPLQITQICHTEVEKMLPLAITFITSIMQPGDICTILGMCGGRDSAKIRALLLNHISKTAPVPTMKMETSIQCSVCTYVVSSLGYLFPRERAQNIVTVLLESLCREFPLPVQPQCNKMVEKYVQLLVEMLLNNTSPNFICTLLHFCEIWEHPINASVPFSDCESCLTLGVLAHVYLGPNVTELQAASFLDTVCQLHPSAMPKCETYVQRHGNQLRVFLSQQQELLDICKRAHLCVSGEKEIAADPCSLGPIYSCRDLQTAVNCGAISFCQKNVWE